jgi:3-methyl-2-oxobutanoate hydroxymethyltransferase
MVTVYDYASACLVHDSQIDAVLVGDSGGVVHLGKANTPMVTMEDMVYMTQAVAKGLTDKLIVADMPFLSYRVSLADTMLNVKSLIQAGAHAIKLEGAGDNLDTIKYIVQSNVPVMGHLGLSPQAVSHSNKVSTGYDIDQLPSEILDGLFEDALSIEQAGCFALILVYVPEDLTKKISAALKIPVIGIGSGSHCDGQILVWHDLLGLKQLFNPAMVKQYLNGKELSVRALDQFANDAHK